MPTSTPIPIRDHTKLQNIGSLSHTTIDGYLDQAVKIASSPIFAGITISTAPTAGHVLTADGSGVGTWQAPAAGSGDSINHFLLIGG